VRSGPERGLRRRCRPLGEFLEGRTREDRDRRVADLGPRRQKRPGHGIGAFVGAVVLSSISADLAKPWTAGVLLALGVYILLRFTLVTARVFGAASVA
jgi:hypothetical protein